MSTHNQWRADGTRVFDARSIQVARCNFTEDAAAIAKLPALAAALAFMVSQIDNPGMASVTLSAYRNTEGMNRAREALAGLEGVIAETVAGLP